MAAGFRKLPIIEPKHQNTFNHRGTGVVCLNDYSKERNTVRTRTNVSNLGEDDEVMICAEDKAPILKKLEALLEPLTSLEKQVGGDIEYLLLRHSNRQLRDVGTVAEEIEYDQSTLATDLQSLGYEVSIRRSVGGGAGSEAVNNLRHSFLRCTPQNSDRVFIVDPKFREQFDIAHRTAEYRKTFQSIPELLVLREDRIMPLVKLICDEIAVSFSELGYPLPPWRKADSLLSKWYPKRSMDVPAPKPMTEPTITLVRSVPLHISASSLTGSSNLARGVPQHQASFRIQAW